MAEALARGSIDVAAAHAFTAQVGKQQVSPGAPIRRLEISFIHGAAWKMLISVYMSAIPLSDEVCMDMQSMSG